MDIHVDPVGVSRKSTDIPLQQSIAVFLEDSMELANGGPADQNAFEVQVFGDNPAAQGKDRVDVRPALHGSDDGIVVVVQNLYLIAIVPSGLPHPVVGLRCPPGAVVAEDEPDSGDVVIENQRANLRRSAVRFSGST